MACVPGGAAIVKRSGVGRRIRLQLCQPLGSDHVVRHRKDRATDSLQMFAPCRASSWCRLQLAIGDRARWFDIGSGAKHAHATDTHCMLPSVGGGTKRVHAAKSSANCEKKMAMGRAGKHRHSGHDRGDIVLDAKDEAKLSAVSDQLCEQVRLSVNSLSHGNRPGRVSR